MQKQQISKNKAAALLKTSLLRTLALLFAIAPAALPQDPDAARIERHGGSAVLTVHTFRPLDAIATQLEAQFGLVVSAEDPLFLFRGDLLDISLEVPKVRPGTLVPARWGLEVTFPVQPDGSPQNARELLARVVAAANRRSPFAYRLDEVAGAFYLVPTRTRDAQGRPLAVTPLLDRPVTIPPGYRPLRESAELLAADLSRQTGLPIGCCESSIAGIPWGLQDTLFRADQEPARSVLRRLGLTHWHLRCDRESCFIGTR